MIRMPRVHVSALVLVAILLLAAGCASPGDSSSGDTGPRTDTPIVAGSVLVIDEGMMLPAGKARVHFQAGRVTRYHDRNRFVPWCSIGARRSPDGGLPQAVEPGRFTVTDVRSGARAGLWPAGGLRIATRMTGVDRGGALGHLTWMVEMRLDSVDQPRVHDMRCAIDREAEWRGRIGLESVREALGALGRLLPPDS